MKKITFITGNKNKFKEASEILVGFEIENREIDLPEIQEIDARKIIEAKLKEVHRLHSGSYFVEDTSLYIGSLKGLPGPLIKWFMASIGLEGIAELAGKYPDQTAYACSMIGYIDESGAMHFFEGRVGGKIVSPRGDSTFGWDPIFLPQGSTETFAEMSVSDKNKISHRKLALTTLADFLHEQGSY